MSTYRSDSNGASHVAGSGLRRGLVAPPEHLSEPPGKCSRCGAGMFPKVMEAVAMLRDGVGAIPYRCSACAREALVKVPGFKTKLDRYDLPELHRKPSLSSKRQIHTKARAWTDERIKSFVEMWNAETPSRTIAHEFGISSHYAIGTYARRFRVRGFDLKSRAHLSKNTGGRRPGGWNRV